MNILTYKNCFAVVGNSSSGIVEAASLKFLVSISALGSQVNSSLAT